VTPEAEITEKRWPRQADGAAALLAAWTAPAPCRRRWALRAAASRLLGEAGRKLHEATHPRIGS
jgi:hypothetical protein